jgi:hypothetical protein
LTIIDTPTAPAVIIPTPVKAVDHRIDKSATVDIKAKINRLREIRALIAPLKEEADTITADILTWAAGNVKRIMWGKTQIALIVNNVNRTNSAEILKAAHPQAYIDSLIEKPFQQIR